MHRDDDLHDHLHLDGDASEARFEQVVDLDASIGAVWDAISDPGGLASWLGSSVELELRPGGRGGRRGRRHGARSVVTDVRSGEQIAWHWWSDTGDLSSVELHLDEHEGHTRLRIVETTLIPWHRTTGHCPAQHRSTRCGRMWPGAAPLGGGHVAARCRVGATAFA